MLVSRFVLLVLAGFGAAGAVAAPVEPHGHQHTVVVGKARIIVPVAPGHCRLDWDHPRDREVLKGFTKSLDKRFSLSLLTASCTTLEKLRERKHKGGLEMVSYLVLNKVQPTLKRLSKSAFAKGMCDAMAAESTDAHLGDGTPREKARALQSIAAKLRKSQTAVLQTTHRACYVGQVKPTDDVPIRIHQVQGLSLVKGQILAIGALSTAGTEIERLLPFTGGLIVDMAGLNKEQ